MNWGIPMIGEGKSQACGKARGSGRKRTKELRKNERFRAKGNARAAFYSSPQDFVKLGQILDISLGGLSIRYVAFGKPTTDNVEVELFGSSGPNGQFGKLPCRIVYDFELADESWGVLQVRRCGLQFGDLSSGQLAQVQSFIETNATQDEA